MAARAHQHSSQTEEIDSTSFVATLPLSISSTEELLQAIYESLHLPGYFGFNWNALSDALRDLHWIHEHRVILVHQTIPEIPAEDLLIYRDILKGSVESWSEGQEHEFRVILPLEVPPS